MTSFDFDFVMTSERLRHHYEQEHGISECTTLSVCMYVCGVFYPFSFTGVLDAVFFLFYWLMLFVYKKRTRTERSLFDIYIYFFSTAHKPLLYWVGTKKRTICAKCLWARCFYLLLSKRRRRDTAFNLYFSCVKEPTVRRLTDGRTNEPNDMSVYACCVQTFTSNISKFNT